ncbi:LON peptidase substrate-binding domain-containing protein [Nocardioides sp. NPDC057767]|uniref:LON peptidase substrate-binding domain-containing protein n=1 Tax=unclassified Nocardioides TaxID=2615069 RepID=UPI0036707FF0
MNERLPMFPLNAVLFPGVTLPLRVFEDRYRAMVHHLLRQEEEERHFGSVAIREGYEVGETGAQSLYRVGVRLLITEVEQHKDGSFDLEVLAVDRIRMDSLVSSGDFPVADVEELPEDHVTVPGSVVDTARATFTAYRAALLEFREDPFTGSLPKDPEFLSWTISATTPLPMPDRQALLEAPDAALRLGMATDLLRAELRAMNVIPSLPATEVARTKWSPN